MHKYHGSTIQMLRSVFPRYYSVHLLLLLLLLCCRVVVLSCCRVVVLCMID